jgi:hypothetical protein
VTPRHAQCIRAPKLNNSQLAERQSGACVSFRISFEKLRDIAASGPVVLAPDLSKPRVVGLTRQLAESYVPVTITVSYAGQDGTPKPFLMIVDWLKVGGDWKIASEIILPVPPVTVIKG